MISEEKRKKMNEIRKLKENNFQNKYLTWRAFHKEFSKNQSRNNQKPQSLKLYLKKTPTKIDHIFFSRLRNKNTLIYKGNKNLQTNYNSFNPYVTMMMTNATNFTMYDHNEYVQKQKPNMQSEHNSFYNSSQNSYKNYKSPKKFFGLDGKTLLTDFNEENTFHKNTLSDLYMKTTAGMRTMMYLSNIKNDDSKLTTSINKHFSMEDEKITNNVLFDVCNSKGDKLLMKEDRDRFYKEHGIEKQLSLEEETGIDNIIRRNKSNNKQINYDQYFLSDTEKKFNCISKKIVKQKFKNPYSSQKKLKVSAQLSDTLEKIRIDLQCQKFQKEYDDICKFNIKANRMPHVKIFTKKYKKNSESINNSQKKNNLKRISIIKNLGCKNLKEFLANKIKDQLEGNPEEKISRFEHLSNLKLEVFILPINHHPELRALSSVCFDDPNGTIYLYGGYGGKKYGDIWKCKLDSGKIEWSKIYNPSKNVEKEDEHENYRYKNDAEKEPRPRFGHTINYYKKKLFVIGGQFFNWEKKLSKNEILWFFDLNRRVWFNSLEDERKIYKKKTKRIYEFIPFVYKTINKININNNDSNEEKNDNKNKKIEYNNTTKNIKKVKINEKMTAKSAKKLRINDINKNNELSDNIKTFYLPKDHSQEIYPCLRRNHLTISVGSHILLYGGFNIDGKFLNDCWIYDINSGRWDILQFTGKYPPPLGYHCGCLVLESEQISSDLLTVYNKPNSNRKTLPFLKLDGVFFFGGMNDNKIPTDLFFHMTIGNKPVIFDIPPTNGKPPEARISATMNFAPEINMLIIHGGRNDLKEPNFFNDITLLDMETFDWIHASFSNFIPYQRAEHGAIAFGNQFIVFGGTTFDHLMNFDLTLVNMDF